ncbi:MAG: hypothetical protein ACI814_005179, partial [Mariniblastus sp.]
RVFRKGPAAYASRVTKTRQVAQKWQPEGKWFAGVDQLNNPSTTGDRVMAWSHWFGPPRTLRQASFLGRI